MSGSTCPNCSKDIGFLAVFKAGLPTMIKCPSCNAAVTYKPVPWLFFIVLVGLYAALLFFTFTDLTQLANSFVSKKLLAEIIVIFGLWVPFEVIVTFYLRKKCTLELK